MASDGKDEGGASLNVSVGKEVDAAFGDVIRGLLKRPAEEAGNLIADSIGIIGDRVRRKRQLNAQLGLEEVRKKLENDRIDMKDITPPNEEEFHLLMNGLSLSSDESLRDMWAGLFAKALEPNSGVSAERPFISVLQSLSPADAKIIDFLAFTVKANEELEQNFVSFQPKNFRNITPEETERISEAQKKHAELRGVVVRKIEDKAISYGLNSIPDKNWSINLIRQGIIERIPPHKPYTNISSFAHFGTGSLDEGTISGALNDISKYISYIDSYSKIGSSPPEYLFSKIAQGPELIIQVRLSEFGRRLAVACGLL